MKIIEWLISLLWPGLVPASNVAEGEYDQGVGNFQADAALTETPCLVKIGTDVDHIAVCGDGEIPDGIALSEITAAEITAGLRIAVALLGSAPGTRKALAAGAIDPTSVDFIVTAASGRVKALPTAAGTYYIVGKPITAASAAGDTIEFTPCLPVQRVVTE